MDREKRSTNSWSAKQFNQMIANGKIRFDHPIQRKGGQWDNYKMSLFINSMAEGYPIPPFYALKEEGIYYILDGQQRLTTVEKCLTNQLILNDETPECDGHVMAEARFEELHEDLQDEIKGCMFTLYSYVDISYEEIEDIFFRLNSGEALSNIQTAKAKLGVELSKKMSELTSHPLFSEKIKFTTNQIKKEEDLKVISEFIMLYDKDYEMTKAGFTPTEVTNYVGNLRQRTNEAEKFIEVAKNMLNFLDEAIEQPNKQFLKPTNLPMLFNVANYAIEENIPASVFKQWYENFVEDLKVKDVESQSKWIKKYKEYGGNGSKKPDKIMGRVDTLIQSFKEAPKQMVIDQVDDNEVVEVL